MPGPSPKSNPDPILLSRLAELSATATAVAEAAVSGSPPRWFRPSGMASKLSDLPAYSEFFSRREQELTFEKTVADKDDFGTVGDLMMLQLQGDLLVAMEQAFRARHQSSCRMRLHAAARLRGHGHEAGVIRIGLAGYIVGIDKLNKGEPTA